MSEPLSSHEIEDVLSSIRRLVSDDLRPGARADVPPGPAFAAEAGKLLLTPALRVVAETALPPERAAVDSLPEPGLDVLASLAPLAPATDDYTEDYAEVSADAAALDATSDLPDPDLPGPEMVAPDLPEWQDDLANPDDILWSAPGTPEGSLADIVEEDAAPAPAEPVVTGHWTAQDLPDLPGADWVQEEPDWVEPEPVAFVPHPRKPALTDDPLARAWADRAEAEVRAELNPAPPRPEPAAAAPQPEPGLFDGDDPVLDEETLRDIVRDIIREELAGTLGERITRNVRKLVRVEINRALTAREFE